MITLRAISETITSIIVTSALIIISITIFYYALLILQQSSISAEYGYIKTTFINLANSFPDIIEGGSYAAGIPSRVVGIGYKELVNSGINIIVSKDGNNIFNYNDNPIAIEAIAYHAIVTTNSTLYGTDDGIVNQTLLIPRVTEIYHKGATYIRLDTCRVYVKTYEITDPSGTKYIINILYVKFTPKIISSSPRRLVISLYDVNTTTISDVDDVTIKVQQGSSAQIYELREYFDIPSGATIDVNIVIKEVGVVYL